MFFNYIGFCVLIILILRIYTNFKRKYQYWKKRGVKSLPTVFPFGNIHTLFSRETGITPCIRDWYNSMDEKVIGLYAIDEPILLVKDPDIIKKILVRDFNHFTDRGVYIDNREPTAGHLWKLPGSKWKPLRAKISTCFSIGKLKMMFETLSNVGKEMEKHLEQNLDQKFINVEELCQRFTVDVIASTVFGVEINSFLDKRNQYLLMEEDLVKSESRIRMLKASLQIIVPNFFEIFSFIKFETVKSSVLAFVYEMVRTVIEFREKTGTVRNDMMQLLIQLKNFGRVDDDDGKKTKIDRNETCLTMEELVAQAYTFFFVGSETASTALMMVLYECALNEDIQKRLQDDITEILEKFDGDVTYKAILDMCYLNMVISETLRKYPVLGFLQRQAVTDYTISDLNLKIDKGTRLYFSIQGLHWDPKYFPQPEKFDPNRFSKENEESIYPFSYLPFGDGPRNCIGKRLGHFMVAVGAVYFFRKFNVSVCEKTEIPMKINPLAYTIKPTNPIYLKISKR